jgi:hypothetical protein
MNMGYILLFYILSHCYIVQWLDFIIVSIDNCNILCKTIPHPEVLPVMGYEENKDKLYWIRNHSQVSILAMKVIVCLAGKVSVRTMYKCSALTT